MLAVDTNRNGTVKIVRADASNDSAAVGAIVAAFGADPVARWFYPDPVTYREVFPSFVRAFARPAIAHGSAYIMADGSGAALWLPPGTHPDETALGEIVEASVPETFRAAVWALLGEMERRHPKEPHWYLPMIGVIPGRQRQGYGSALLGYALEHGPAGEMLAYLEASTIKSVRLYERHGFRVVGTIQAGSSPPLFSMVRKPRH